MQLPRRSLGLNNGGLKKSKQTVLEFPQQQDLQRGHILCCF